MFEQKLKTMHPNRHKITYDISELFEYLDTLKDLCCLVYVQRRNVLSLFLILQKRSSSAFVNYFNFARTQPCSYFQSV